MAGADLFLFEASKPNEVRDAHVMDELLPLDDDCNNWEFVSSEVDENSDFLIVEVRRLIDTGDPQDRALIQDGAVELPPTLVISAWGDSAPVAYHGANRARGSIRFYNGNYNAEDALYAQIDQESEGYFDLVARNYEVKPIVTEYVDICFSWDQLLAQGVPNSTFSVVGIEPRVDAAVAEHVHHFILYGSYDALDDAGKCSDIDYGMNPVYGWGPGNGPLNYPLEVGMYVGPGGSFRSFRFQIHYNNPKLKEGNFDSSGVRLHYTSKMRPIEIGVANLADSTLWLRGQPVGMGLTEHKFSCPASCTKTFIQEDEPVTVFREIVHMHQRGMAAKNELIRDGEVVHTGQVDYFQFELQGIQSIQQTPYEVRRGDGFNSYCYYKNENYGSFGRNASQEMCMITLMYYPKKTWLGMAPWFCSPQPIFPPCLAEYESQTLDELPRKFNESTTEECVEPESGTSGASMAAFGFSLASMLTLVSFVSLESLGL
jgi:hypothetical protein